MKASAFLLPQLIVLWSEGFVNEFDTGVKCVVASTKRDKALNVDLWQTLLELLEVHQVRFHWVKGHAENPYNNRCDQLAVAERRKYG